MKVGTGRYKAKKQGTTIRGPAPLLRLGRPNGGEDENLDGTQTGRLKRPFNQPQELVDSELNSVFFGFSLQVSEEGVAESWRQNFPSEMAPVFPSSKSRVPLVFRGNSNS